MSSLALISCLDHAQYLWTQVWYADDATACASLESLREWFCLLRERGPSIGYFPQLSKSYLVVDKKHCLRAKEEFASLSINVVDSQRLLGGAIGSDSGILTV